MSLEDDHNRRPGSSLMKLINKEVEETKVESKKASQDAGKRLKRKMSLFFREKAELLSLG